MWFLIYFLFFKNSLVTKRTERIIFRVFLSCDIIFNNCRYIKKGFFFNEINKWMKLISMSVQEVRDTTQLIGKCIL